MIRRALAVLMLTAAVASPAAACDPYWDDCWWWWEEPVQEVEPWWQEPAWGFAPEPAPAPEPVWEPAPVIPEGLYLVTEVYVADVVSVAGPLTTYSTATASETPGTYARVIDTVGTGAVSEYDGSAFNGRTALDDGRGVAGTYYENFVLSGGTFVPVSVVFFQDDSALAQTSPQPTPSPAPPVAPTPVPISAIPSTPAPAAATPAPAGVGPTSPAPTPAPTPIAVARIDPIIEPPPPPPPWSEPTTAPRVPVIRPGVSTSPTDEVRSEIEVLRGRAIPLWVRVAVDGVTQPVASWRMRSGEHVALGPASGAGDDALTARWDVVTPPGSAWVLGLETTTVVGGVPHFTLAEVIVVVRSPALVR